MSSTDLQHRLQTILSERKLQPREVLVAPDPLGGWRVRVVAVGFSGLGDAERRAVVGEALAGEPLAWRQLLAPEEAAVAGPFPMADESQLPLWPETLSRGQQQAGAHRAAVFLSDLEDPMTPPLNVTFYSLRGGVGRSTMLARTAHLLAAEGRRVVCLDMDLEAPGLAALFGVEAEIRPGQGLAELLLAIDQGRRPELAEHLLPIDADDRLFLIPAGRPGPDYALTLRFLDPTAWYREHENPLRMLFDDVATGLPFRPDVVLIDARTGISAISAPLLFDLADLAIVSFFPHEQARLGTQTLVQGLLAAHNRRGKLLDDHSCGPDVRFVISPLPTATPAITQRYFHRALEWISEWMAPVQTARTRLGLIEVDESEVTHGIVYRDDVATTDAIAGTHLLLELYAPIAAWISRLLPVPAEAEATPAPTAVKTKVLNGLRVDPGAAEDQHDLLSVFIETGTVRQALDLAYPLVLGRKGTGKTALFRRLAEQPTPHQQAVVVHPPQGMQSEARWYLTPAGFHEVEQVAEGRQQGVWNSFWLGYLLIALVKQLDHPRRIELGGLPSTARVAKPLDFLDWLTAVNRTARSALLLEEALIDLDASLTEPVVLLWDGLDTGFGNEAADRQRRARALVGLLELIIAWDKRLTRLRFKVMLREDLWRELRLENKSHLYGRSVALRWSDQIAFLKVALKQLWRSDDLRRFVTQGVSNPDMVKEAGVEAWTDEQTVKVWNLIVGARMSGGNTAFTRNWVWKRLGDANGDHAPRHLLQLLRAAIAAECQLEARNPYPRSLIRPSALVKALPEVSDKAVDALTQEEFVELQPLIARLKEIGRTPFPASELDGASDIPPDLRSLAREVGLLGVHEGTERQAERYRIPELYRLGLNMTRKGQA